jgi:hypothetical protein
LPDDLEWADLPAGHPVLAEWLEGASCGPPVRTLVVRAVHASAQGVSAARWRRDLLTGHPDGRPCWPRPRRACTALRADQWWAYPLTTFGVLAAFVAYAAYAAPYLSPFYPSCPSFHCGAVPGSHAAPHLGWFGGPGGRPGVPHTSRGRLACRPGEWLPGPGPAPAGAGPVVTGQRRRHPLAGITARWRNGTGGAEPG